MAAQLFGSSTTSSYLALHNASWLTTQVMTMSLVYRHTSLIWQVRSQITTVKRISPLSKSQTFFNCQCILKPKNMFTLSVIKCTIAQDPKNDAKVKIINNFFFKFPKTILRARQAPKIINMNMIEKCHISEAL